MRPQVSLVCLTSNFIPPGLSGLSTASGSITQGTSSPTSVHLDLRVSPTLSPLHHVVSPSASPSLSMIREEINAPVHHGESDSDGLALTDACSRAWGRRHNSSNYFHPQISVTDEMGGQVTLITSVSSCESVSSVECIDPNAREVEMEELDNQDDIDFQRQTTYPEPGLGYQPGQYDMMYDSQEMSSNPFTPIAPMLPSFIVSPCDPSRPSIVRGIGKGQCSNDNYEESKETTEKLPTNVDESQNNHCYSFKQGPLGSREERRESFTLPKNASLRSTFPPPSSGIGNNDNPFMLNFNNVLNNTLENGRTSSHHAPYRNVFASDLMQITASGSFQVTLSNSCAQLATSDVLGIVKDLIERGKPREFVVGGCGDNGLALEYPSGVQIELRVCKGELKMRRISGDHHQYSELCRELISCMTV